ncbi:type VI secretion system-associated protein TagF [uncultured Amaricoccus sp.]|uniref:type VI secretion system-associated protein TagF n=1 Tax=uncultured Amaricoccus sp. TaxID=339341 RepID=UPI002616E765|nr:type VI secretion system-associated protein TagF [uncultured Amaricoccus sp.]
MPHPHLMPDPDPTPPGFFGKLPSTGDFVTRGLPAAFVRFWDGWVSRHLVARLDRALRFFLGSPGPLTGVVLPSTDRAGRRYPLTLAARADTPAAPAWYAMLEAIAAAALAECLTPDALEARLATCPGAADRVAGLGDPPPLLLWTGSVPLRADPDAPAVILDRLLGAA